MRKISEAALLKEALESMTALRDDMLERARREALRRGDDDIVVEAGNGVWFRFNLTITKLEESK